MIDINQLLKLTARTAFALTSDAIIILNKTGTILYANEKSESWMGYTKSELIGKNLTTFGLVTPGSYPVVIKNLALRFLGQEIAPYKVEFVAKDKRILLGIINGHLIKDENGSVIADLVLITDISEKETYEKELALEKEKMDIYVDLVGVVIVILDSKGNVKLINKKGCEVLKTTKNDAIGKNWLETFVPEKERIETQKVFSKIISGNLEGVEKHQNKIITTSGEERLILWYNTFLKDENGNVYETLSSGDDITERFLAEQELAKKTEDLEKTNQLMIGRELKMVALKKENEELKKKLTK
jgi:PAS domain S-box-containing protein